MQSTSPAPRLSSDTASHSDSQDSAHRWIGVVSDRLQRQWPSIDPARLDDLAADLWRDERLRALPPEQAADDWLRPVNVQG